MENKNCLFQYATKHKVIVDSELISFSEAKKLWEENLSDLIDRWNEFESPEMCIWTNCDTNTSYNNQEYDIDYRDCELLNGRFYRIKKEEISLPK